MSKKRQYELAYHHELKDRLAQLALAMNTPRKVDYVRAALCDTDKHLSDALQTMKPTFESYPSDLTSGRMLLEVFFAIVVQKQTDAEIEFTKDMRLALESFVAPLGDHDSALLAYNATCDYFADGFSYHTHGMSIAERTVSLLTHRALYNLESAIREAIDEAKKGGKGNV